MNNLIRLQEIFRDVFDNPTLQIGPETSPASLPDWDSVATVNLVLATEAEFGIRFTTDEVATIRSVANILAVVNRHIGRSS